MIGFTKLGNVGSFLFALGLLMIGRLLGLRGLLGLLGLRG